MSALAGISESNRRQLTKLHRRTNGLVDIDEAAAVLGLDRSRTAKLLAHWATQGWTRRLRRGLYLLIPLEATSPENWTADPWIVAVRLFMPCYIAGWSACEHWGFTEQIFRDVAVFTAAGIRERRVITDQTIFALRRIPERLLFGLRRVWRQDVQVQVSDPTRTVIDILNDPKWGGGIRHVSQILGAYRASEHLDETLLVTYIQRLGNAAVAKRLGYLWELGASADSGASLLRQLREMMTSGYTMLDPSVVSRGPFLARWNLRLNVDVT
jgi:predicted transcriptional regulator of viral defense system